VHVKVKTPASASPQPASALHCFHGFGSNTWSWSLVQQNLADRLNALVTAHDMPGFGLTER
jgi:pimeloyl-ACP methyl ester carboxylesterase